MTQNSVLDYGSVFLMVEKAPLGFVTIVTLRQYSVKECPVIFKPFSIPKLRDFKLSSYLS